MLKMQLQECQLEPTKLQQTQFELEIAHFLISFRLPCLVKQVGYFTPARAETQWFLVFEHVDFRPCLLN